jgi:hypothetical protein
MVGFSWGTIGARLQFSATNFTDYEKEIRENL